MDILFSFASVILVIFLAYWGTRWFSSRYKTITDGKYIKILERTVLGKDRHLVLIRINEKAFLLGMGGQSIETICAMDANELGETKSSVKPADFNTILKDMISKNMFSFSKNIFNKNIFNKNMFKKRER